MAGLCLPVLVILGFAILALAISRVKIRVMPLLLLGASLLASAQTQAAGQNEAQTLPMSDPPLHQTTSPARPLPPPSAAPGLVQHPAVSSWGLLPAGEDPQNQMGWTFIKHLGNDQQTFWTSPFHLSRGSAEHAIPFLAFTGTLIAADSWISQQVPDSPSQLNRSQNFSNFAAYSLVGTAGAAYIWGHFTRNDHLRETGLLSAEAAINSTAVSYVLKGLTQRPRPEVGNGNGTFFQGGNSFPSEHAAVAWSVASILAHEYPGPLTKIFAYGLASGITLARVTGKQHFPSDVVVGSALGWYLGRQIYRAHHDLAIGGTAWGSTAPEPGEPRPHSIENMASPYVPLDSWIYPAFERLAAWGYVQTEMLGQRPWTRLECARLLEEAGSRISADTSNGIAGEAATIYRSLQKQFFPEQETLDGSPNLGLRVDSIYSRVTAISGPPITDSYNFGSTITNDFGRPFQEGANTYSGVSSYGTAGAFSFYLRAEYQHAPFAAGSSADVRQAVASQQGVPVAPYTPFAEMNRARIIEGYGSLTFKGMQFSFGKQSLWWGPTETGSMMWSTNAEPITMLRISTPTPFTLPSFLRWLGPVRSEFFLGQLEGQQYIVNAKGVVGPSQFKPQPYVHGQKLSFKPTPNLEFGFSRTVVFAGLGHPFTLGNFWRSFGSLGSTAGAGVSVSGDEGDRRSGFDFSYRLPHLRKWVTLYTDSFCDDDVSPLAAPQRCAWSPGLYLSQLPHLSKFDFRAEGVYTDVPGLALGSNYQNIIYRSGYTNYGDIIGNWVGRAGRGVQLSSTYWLSPQNKIQLGYRHQGVDRDFLEGGRLDDISLRSDFMLGPNLAVSGSAQYERWNFPLLAPTAKSNLTVSVGFTYYPKWRLGR